MSLMTVLSVSVRPDRFTTYEARVQRLAEKAVAKKEPFEWAARQVMAAFQARMATARRGRRHAEALRVREEIGGTTDVQPRDMR